MGRVCIPDYEYVERRKKAVELMQKDHLDVLIVNGTESDYANPRYFCGFWPLFERCGVAIAANGNAAVMVGPESVIFAGDVSRIKNVYPCLYYREGANPSYPETHTNTYNEVLEDLGVKDKHIRIGIGGYMETTVVMMDGLKECYPEAEIVNADHIMVDLRKIKSANEIACIREGFRIVEIATKEVINALHPGVTELQMVGVAQKAIYENGAEYEGLPMYVFSEKSTSHAISRSSYRVIEKGDIVQLNLSAKIDGYSPALGIPVGMGKYSPEKKDLVDFCLSAHKWTEKQLRAGVMASDVAKGFLKYFEDNGRRQNYVYGPCHGTGMIEVEAPWMETTSNYLLQPNMTFQIDTFVSGPTFGLRWEKGITITENGFESNCGELDYVELDF